MREPAITHSGLGSRISHNSRLPNLQAEPTFSHHDIRIYSATRCRNRWVLLRLWKRDRKLSTPRRVYPEETFCTFIHRESKRSERSGHLCQILLVYCTNRQGLVVSLGAELGDKTILSLYSNCRDTDYIGWYRQDQILGVLLTTIRRDSIVDGCEEIKARFVRSIRGALLVRDDHSLHICLLRPGELGAFTVSDQPAPSPDSKD